MTKRKKKRIDIAEHYVRGAYAIRKKFTDLTVQCDTKLGQMERLRDELKSLQKDVRGVKVSNMGSAMKATAMLENVIKLENLMSKLEGETKDVTAEIESLERDAASLYDTIVSRYPGYTEEELRDALADKLRGMENI